MSVLHAAGAGAWVERRRTMVGARFSRPVSGLRLEFGAWRLADGPRPNRRTAQGGWRVLHRPPLFLRILPWPGRAGPGWVPGSHHARERSQAPWVVCRAAHKLRTRHYSPNTPLCWRSEGNGAVVATRARWPLTCAIFCATERRSVLTNGGAHAPCCLLGGPARSLPARSRRACLHQDADRTCRAGGLH